MKLELNTYGAWRTVLTALAARLRDHASDYITHPDDACKHSDLLAASKYLRQCAQAEPTIDINIKIAVPENWSDRLDMQWIVEREIHADRWSWSYAAPQAMNTQADAIEALRMALDALSCTGESHDPGHRCTRCDDYVDRNAVVRARIRAVLAAQGGDL